MFFLSEINAKFFKNNLVGEDMNDKIIIAHRGEFNIGKLIDGGANMIEFDLRKTKDGVYVAFHSDSVNGRKVRDLTYSELNSFASVEIPKVESFLEEYGKGIGFDVHLKERGYEQEALAFLLGYVNKKDLLITSEHLESLKKIREVDPKIKLGLILLRGNLGKNVILDKLVGGANSKQALEDCESNGFEYIVPSVWYLNDGYLDSAHSKGIGVLPWTVNSKNGMEKYLGDERIAGIITDKPEVAVSLR